MFKRLKQKILAIREKLKLSGAWAKRMLLTAQGALISYVAVIISSTLFFALTPNLLNKDVGFEDSFYFSVITITTLGYGDILPCGTAGRLAASFVSLSGVVLLGFFLVGIAGRLVTRQERAIIDAAKMDLDTRYKFNREEIALYCIFIIDRSQELDLEFTDRMASADNFKQYFTENNQQRWLEFGRKFDAEPDMVKQILRILESLELQIRQFLTIAKIDDPALFARINQAAEYIGRTRRMELSDPSLTNIFCRRLWTIIAEWEREKPNRNPNSLKDAIARV